MFVSILFVGTSSDDNEWDDDDDDDDDDETNPTEDSTLESYSKDDPTFAGDENLTELHQLLKKYGIDNIFPPIDGTALFTMLCKINHSCEPNVIVTYELSEKYGLVANLNALRVIEPGEELLQSYIDQTLG